MQEFYECFAIGFVLASVIGPISILCFKQTIIYGYQTGVAAVLGAATADGIYAAIAAFGITIIYDFLISQQLILKIFGGAFLLYLGFKILNSKIENKKNLAVKKQNLLKNYFSILFLTIYNPLTIILFLSVFSSTNLLERGHNNPILMVLGIFLGSLASYLILIIVALLVKKNSNTKTLEIINKISGLIIIGFAIFSFIDVWQK